MLPRQTVLFERPVPGINAGTRPSSPSHATCSPGATGAQVRELVGWALEQRERTILYGWCKQNVAFVRKHMVPLQMWWRTNLHPSHETLKAFWSTHRVSLAIVMPSRKKYRLVEQIINAL